MVAPFATRGFAVEVSAVILMSSKHAVLTLNDLRQLEEVLMPSLSPTMEAGNITSWAKAEGSFLLISSRAACKLTCQHLR
jgi:hypothetical protein